MKNIKVVFSIIVLLFLNSCSYLNYCYYAKISPKTTQKKEFVLKLINNPEKYDSLLVNSEFYDLKNSELMKSEKSKIIEILKNFKKNMISEPSLDEELLPYMDYSSLRHEIAFVLDYNDQSKIISVLFYNDNSSWYILSIKAGCYRLQKYNNGGKNIP